ncbi:peptide/nickel transport system permease protein [Bosea sp. OK403]|jgi:peptide/nickel transport system permease protein|uniref:ABC transporter permease n=1 Tax=Bosea sp. OK403 TaxID=1855286 RepID=UPI0008E5E2A6|nr:ABC transporter permease [Bosea sp. OK403]SFI04570.1 peptide/nickel transport system permease protein [Bosea sp. OK403]
MLVYAARRILGMVVVLFAMSAVVFAAIHLLPGSVAHMVLGEYATADAVAALELKLGLRDPILVQYWRWLSGVLHGEFGQALSIDQPVARLIGGALERSAVLGGMSLLLVALMGIALGIHSAVHRGSLSDRVLTMMQYTLIAIPEFFWCTVAIIVFAVWLGWLPATGYTPLADAGLLQWLRHLILPVICLSLGLTAHVSRMVRSSMLEAIESRYVLAARAKGVPERLVLLRHALPNAMLPAITVLAIDAGILIGGIVVAETVFSFPGLGSLLMYAIQNHDIPLLQAGMLVVTAVYSLATLVADLASAMLNPRIRLGGAH